MHFLLIGLLIFAGLVYSQKLPKYIVPCVRTDPNLNKCAYDHGLLAIPHILKGDRRFKVPPLTPLKIPKVSLQPNDNLKIELNDLVVHGIENIQLRDIKLDFDRNTIKVTLYTDFLTLLAQYEIEGRLIVPISGSGPGNITAVNVDIEYNIDFNRIQKNGKDYFSIKRDEMTLQSKKTYYKLDNLFGNPQLSDETNKILNENDSEVTRELHGPITEAIRSIVTTLMKNYLTDFPIDQLFLPE